MNKGGRMITTEDAEGWTKPPDISVVKTVMRICRSGFSPSKPERRPEGRPAATRHVGRPSVRQVYVSSVVNQRISGSVERTGVLFA